MSDKEREELIESFRKTMNEANMKIYTLVMQLDEVEAKNKSLEAKNKSLNAELERTLQQLNTVKNELRTVLSENKPNIITVTATNGLDRTIAIVDKKYTIREENHV